MVPPPVGGNWREYDELVLDPVLRAAVSAFVETGYHGATARRIAQLAGLSVPGMYHHFATKQDMLVGILDLTMDDLLGRGHEAKEEGGAIPFAPSVSSWSASRSGTEWVRRPPPRPSPIGTSISRSG